MENSRLPVNSSSILQIALGAGEKLGYNMKIVT